MKVTYLKRSVVENLLSYACDLYPKESVFLLRGNVSKDRVFINDTVIPPFATHGGGFSTFPLHMLPIDFSNRLHFCTPTYPLVSEILS